jgi:(1->4)-alpha-D-glucan 1-alpha-D-glucosylmutase
MDIPNSTYRLQFRSGMTFDKAVDIVPYLKSLGISHLYASPIFTATAGSTHGYDITDFNEIDPVIGGQEGFDRLSAALQDAGLGLILDIVPNHMAASTENAWWADVLKFGRESRYARHFDIDWSDRLTLPILGKPFEGALADGEMNLLRDEQSGDWMLCYFDNRLPLHPESTLEISGDGTDKALISRIHDLQPYRLMFWQDASKTLSYRRFFEVTGLVGVRVEDEAVFADSHRLLLEMLRVGKVQGLRLDHIDGLADPAGYLERLRAAVGPQTFIVAEKILGHDEELPESWPIQGTTGYEFISALSNLFIDDRGIDELKATYTDISPGTADFAAGLRAAKTLMVMRNFEEETTRLVEIAHSLIPSIGRHLIANAILEMLVAFPVYRTYGHEGQCEAADFAIIDQIKAAAARHVTDQAALEAVAALLQDGPKAEEFQRRFQQLSGPVMAKAMEDTLFYRHNLLLAANEVGGDPGERPGGADVFHRQMQQRASLQPHGLSATSTHDTKRGEDARARLYALSEEPDTWRRGFQRWQEMNRHHLVDLPGGLTPDSNVAWMLYQALAGIWPEEFRDGAAESLGERFVAYAEKAVREAKLETSWDAPHQQYEDAVKAYAAALTASASLTFHEDFAEVMKPIAAAGYLNSLSQTLIKLTAPGIPDLYQGAEAVDFSLVDPDNRRAIDFNQHAHMLTSTAPTSQLTVPALKQRIVKIALNLRNRDPMLFSHGKYVPLEIIGRHKAHAVAYARELDGHYAISVAPRMMLGRLEPGALFASPEFWDGTAIAPPTALRGRKRDLITGHEVDTGETIPLSQLLGRQPVALLEPTD